MPWTCDSRNYLNDIVTGLGIEFTEAQLNSSSWRCEEHPLAVHLVRVVVWVSRRRDSSIRFGEDVLRARRRAEVRPESGGRV